MKNSLFQKDEEFVALYQHYVKMVYQICYMHLKNAADAEDMTQNTFIKLLHEKKSFENEEHVKAWLIRTSSNLCRNELKHWWRKKKENTELEVPVVEKCDETLSEIIRLPFRYKNVIYLYYYMGYATKEIAQLMNEKESTIRSLLSRGRERLKNLIGENDDE